MLGKPLPLPKKIFGFPLARLTGIIPAIVLIIHQ
jgi:hypothetical protein